MIGQMFVSKAEWLVVCTCCGSVDECESSLHVSRVLGEVARALKIAGQRVAVHVVKHAKSRQLWVVRTVGKKQQWEGPQSYGETDVRVRTPHGWFVVMATPLVATLGAEAA